MAHRDCGAQRRSPGRDDGVGKLGKEAALVSTEKPIALTRDCTAIMIPSGEKIELVAGDTVWLTQALGGAYTVMTERGYTARIDGQDADALGLTPPDDLQPSR